MTDAELQDIKELALNLTGNDREEMRHLGETMLTLIAEVATLRRFLDAEKVQCDGMGKRNGEAMRILGVTINNREGIVEGASRVVAERDAYRAMVCDLVAAAKANNQTAALWDRARELLK